MSPAKEHALWDFSQDLYGRPGVAEACLSLQDRRGLDVNILLFCCWAGMRGQALTVEALAACLDTVRPWQDQVVKPLRAVRRWLKVGENQLVVRATATRGPSAIALELRSGDTRLAESSAADVC